MLQDLFIQGSTNSMIAKYLVKSYEYFPNEDYAVHWLSTFTLTVSLKTCKVTPTQDSFKILTISDYKNFVISDQITELSETSMRLLKDLMSVKTSSTRKIKQFEQALKLGEMTNG